MYGWGDVKSKQKSTAGWLAAFPVFEPHWQICMAGGFSTGIDDFCSFDIVDCQQVLLISAHLTIITNMDYILAVYRRIRGQQKRTDTKIFTISFGVHSMQFCWWIRTQNSFFIGKSNPGIYSVVPNWVVY